MTIQTGNTAPPLIVFTDLDGTLLDHHSYSFAAALPALNSLEQLSVPVIPVTSKTVAEAQQLRPSLNNHHPFIVENGCALVIPNGYFNEPLEEPLDDGSSVLRFSPPYHELLQTIRQWRNKHGFQLQGFGDWDANSVAKHTGLPVESAALAKQRIGSEPFLWQDTDDAFETFSQLISSEGLRCVKGGRFFHLLGQADKAKAVAKLLELYKTHQRFTPHTVALGDSPNDLQMLLTADTAVIVKKHDGSHMEYLGDNRVLFTEGTGPVGWNEAIQQLLKEMEKADV